MGGARRSGPLTRRFSSELPETTIDSHPKAKTTKRSATFTFSSSTAGATFQCSLDGAVFAGCASPKTYKGLAQRVHVFRVRAVDPLGNVDPTPASFRWRITT